MSALLHSYKFNFVMIVALYYISGKLGLLLSFFEQSVTLVWPPAGIALAALLLLGLKYWPAIAVGAFLVNFQSDLPLLSVIGIMVGNTSTAVIGAYLLIYIFKFRSSFERLYDVFIYIGSAVILSPMISATIGVSSLILGGVMEFSYFGNIWIGWWIGDAIGILIIGSLIAVWVYNFPMKLVKKHVIEAFVLFLVLIAVSIIVFGIQKLPTDIIGPLSYIVFPVAIVISIRFKQLGAVSAAFIVSILAIWGVVDQLGLMQKESLRESLLYLHGYLATLSVTSMLIAASILERLEASNVLQESIGKYKSLSDKQEILKKSRIDLKNSIKQRNVDLENINYYLEIEVDQHNRTSSSLQRFRSALDSSLDAIYLIDPDIHCFIDSNRAAWELLGYDRDELLCLGPSDIKPLMNKQQLDQYFSRVCDDQNEKIVISTIHQRKDGSSFPVEVKINSVVIDDRALIIAIARDVTEKHKAELIINDSRATIRTLIDAPTDDYFLLFDLDNNILELNEAAAKQLNESVDNLRGKNLADLFEADVVERRNNWGELVKSKKTPMSFQDERNGQIFDIRVYPVIDNNQAVIRLAVFGRDITELTNETDKRLTRERDQRDTLVREVHHRIKNNLQSVTGLLRRQVRKNPENEPSINDAISQVEAIAAVFGLQGIEDNLDRIDLAEMMESIIGANASLFSESWPIHFINKTNSCFIVHADDAVPLALVFNELVTNAIKHSAGYDGSNDVSDIQVTIDQSEEFVSITVINQGKLQQGFDFYNECGTGTGLKLVKSLIPLDINNFSLTSNNKQVVAQLKLTSKMLTIL